MEIGIGVGHNPATVEVSLDKLGALIELFPEHARTTEALIAVVGAAAKCSSLDHLSVCNNSIYGGDPPDKEKEEA